MDLSSLQISGPLSEHVEEVSRELLRRGYKPLSSLNLLRLMARFSEWSESHRVNLKKLSTSDIERFFEDRRNSHYISYRTPRALDPILSFLQESGIIRIAGSESIKAQKSDPLTHFLDDYINYLSNERSLCSGTVRVYREVAEGFLRTHVKNGKLEVGSLSGEELSKFILSVVHHVSTGYAQYKVSALRSVLKYLYVHSYTATDLSVSVPSVAGRRQSCLPRALKSSEVKELLKSCDRRTRIGRRDFAAIVLMVRLGLRVGEVAALELGDLHWETGEITINGKGNQKDRLPLPEDVGKALASYIRFSRPSLIESRKIFTRIRAPYQALTTGGLKHIVYKAARSAGLKSVHAHCLRHTAATEMLRKNVRLSDIAQVLRHRHLDSTALYAKVDREALRTIAQPWNTGGVS